MKFLSLIFILLLFHCAAFSRMAVDSIKYNYNSEAYYKKTGINIYIISKDKYFNFTSRIIVWQTKLVALFHSKKMKVIFATSTADAGEKIAALVQKHNYTINNLWFDSHGKYRKGYSSFMIGVDEYYYKNISDTNHISSLKKIASYCNSHTNIGLGSCFAAADYTFPVLRNGTYENMHGDSLLRGMGNIFKESTVYACKSWVMAKPWILGSKNALAGYPLDRQYKDTIFLPVWNRMGTWDKYSATSHEIETINTVYLTNNGEILVQDKSYLAQKKAQRKLARNLKKLRPDLYDLSM
ncbi:MAG: hypothetical protein JWN83_2155 [Chitinophagaceae bacterium]|nr:hypothetical protein [Chitinophagaceae bacterium]